MSHWLMILKYNVYIDGLVRDCINSIANSLKLLRSYDMPVIWWFFEEKKKINEKVLKFAKIIFSFVFFRNWRFGFCFSDKKFCLVSGTWQKYATFIERYIKWNMQLTAIEQGNEWVKRMGWVWGVRIYSPAWQMSWNSISRNMFISPGALGFNLEKNVESWNFQESYLDAHLTPW